MWTCSADRDWGNSLLWLKYREREWSQESSGVVFRSPRFVSWGRCQTFPSLHSWYCYSALQHCSNRMDLSLNACLCEGWGGGVAQMKMKSQHVRTAATCSTDIGITSMLQRQSRKSSGLDIIHANFFFLFQESADTERHAANVELQLEICRWDVQMWETRTFNLQVPHDNVFI